MKSTLNLLGLGMALTGALFKFMHWPGAAMLLVLAAGIIAITGAVYIYSESTAAKNSMTMSLNYCAVIVFLVLSTLFRSLHWEGLLIPTLVAFLAVLSLAVMVIIEKEEHSVPKQFVVSLMSFLILSIVFLVNMA